MQFDPALKELLLRRTGSPSGESLPAEVAAEVIAVAARLADPLAPVPGLDVVARLGEVVTGRVPLGALLEVRRHPNVISLKASRALSPALPSSLPEVLGELALPWARRERGFPTGRGVIVGVADWGLDFAHANFRDARGRTRIACLWDQRGGPHPSSPAPFGYGRLLVREQIDAALATDDPYAALGYDPALGDPRGVGTHGTHVTDIAAGSGRAPGAMPGVAPEADLVFVHLMRDDTREQDTLGDSVRLLEAVRFICDEAGARPVVMNLSLGRHGGPHDGTSLVERGLDALLDEAPGRACVMSTGNYYDARAHAEGRVITGESVSLGWEVPAGAAEPELEVWYAGEDELVVELVDPDGQLRARATLGEEAVVREGGRVIASLFHRRHDPNNGDNHVDVLLWPDAPAGRWQVVLGGARVLDGRFHAWVERDDTNEQSRFVGEHVAPQGTTGTICNGHKTIAVGAYDARAPSRGILAFSSVGPTRDGRHKPDLAAPGVGVLAARSSRVVDGARVLDELVRKSGTSMAAPHVTGTVALMFEAALPERLSIDETRALLLGATRPPSVETPEERARFGAGLLDAAAAVQAARARRTPASVEARRAFVDGARFFLEEIDRDLVPAAVAREDLRALSSDERRRLCDGLTQLAASGAWGEVLALHEAAAPALHGLARRDARALWRFLPGNRALLARFEQALQALPEGRDLRLPRWAWSEGARELPLEWLSFAPPLLVGGTRAPVETARSAAGPIFLEGLGSIDLPTRRQVDAVLEEPSFARLSAGLELLSALVQLWASGGRGAMAHPKTAPADVLFWLHRAEVDRLWAAWEERGRNGTRATLPRRGRPCSSSSSRDQRLSRNACSSFFFPGGSAA